MIGEQFDHGDEICGAVVNVRPKQEKIAIWTPYLPTGLLAQMAGSPDAGSPSGPGQAQGPARQAHAESPPCMQIFANAGVMNSDAPIFQV